MQARKMRSMSHNVCALVVLTWHTCSTAIARSRNLGLSGTCMPSFSKASLSYRGANVSRDSKMASCCKLIPMSLLVSTIPRPLATSSYRHTHPNLTLSSAKYLYDRTSATLLDASSTARDAPPDKDANGKWLMHRASSEPAFMAASPSLGGSPTHTCARSIAVRYISSATSPSPAPFPITKGQLLKYFASVGSTVLTIQSTRSFHWSSSTIASPRNLRVGPFLSPVIGVSPGIGVLQPSVLFGLASPDKGV
mmetsp:Transcript_3640/g.8693  ORF Transcript_3640/g.8693 Transcript_3640/m.8693 type:complete len:251 (+) Transcript_3640:222-974(+)